MAMGDKHPSNDAKSNSAENPGSVDDVSTPLPGDSLRQAVSSIGGTVYQAWWSIDAWLRLADADDVIFLENAEDFDVVHRDDATAVQVRRTTGSISLGQAKAQEALEHFWSLSRRAPHRSIQFHYLTTSSTVAERDGNFGGITGIDAWYAARTNVEFADAVARYLKTKLAADSPLRAFLISATPEDVQTHLCQRFYWLTDQQDLEAVKRSVDDRIAVLLEQQQRPMALTSNVRAQLLSRFWELVLEPSLDRRCLTRGELLRQVEAATTTSVPLPMEQLPALLGGAHPAGQLLRLLIQRPPEPPEFLLKRPALAERLETLVRQRQVVLLTGTVHKGKTTLAQLVAAKLCPDAWWLSFAERAVDEVVNVLLALAEQVETKDCPNLLVIDDLDISPKAHRAYRQALALVLHRAGTRGRGVVITAQGATSESAVVQDFNDIVAFEVPELSAEETEALCVEHGCPRDLAGIWGPWVTASTRGHPKLVQVRLAELTTRGWPKPTASDLTKPSSAVTSARQMARLLLTDTVPAPVAEFVYTASECAVPMHRSVAIWLVEKIDGLANAGDVLDNLTGKWLERMEGDCFRATALLQGSTAETWSLRKRQQAHVRLHDAILAKGSLAPAEAAGLLYHAYLAQEPARIAQTAMRLSIIDGNEISREVERELLWLPFVALGPGQTITGDAVADSTLRVLQFRVASTLDSDCLPQICERWAEDVQRITHPDVKAAMLAMMWLSVGFAESSKVPLEPRLDSIDGISTLSREMADQTAEFTRRFFANSRDEDDLPKNGTAVQLVLAAATRSVRDIASLEKLLQWLDELASEDIRAQFDAVLEWPLVQQLGAFVHSAWAAKHEETDDWSPWLTLFQRVDEYAKRRISPRFGREAAKARAIILTEYQRRPEDALIVLDDAEAAFGPSAVLLEQRANLLFHTEDDEAVVRIWHQLQRYPSRGVALDPFASRRAGISAARLQRWDEAKCIFIAAAGSIKPGPLAATKFGLKVDAALATSLGGNQAAAAEQLADAILELPPEATIDDNARWDAVQRAANEVRRIIENRLWRPADADPQIEPGYASSPTLVMPNAEPNQAARSDLIRAQVLRIAATLGTRPTGLREELQALATSNLLHVRFWAAEGLLALTYAEGAGNRFIEALLRFEKATAQMLADGHSTPALRPDERPRPTPAPEIERWFGLLAAGLVCSGSALMVHLSEWHDASRRALGEDAALTATVGLMLDGASQPTEALYSAVANVDNPVPVRCGAAAKLLLEEPEPEITLQLQGFLASALTSDASALRQELWNRHVGRCVADYWRAQAQHRFKFQAPRTSVPALLNAVDDIEHGCGTLRSVLEAAAFAVGQRFGDIAQQIS